MFTLFSGQNAVETVLQAVTDRRERYDQALEAQRYMCCNPYGEFFLINCPFSSKLLELKHANESVLEDVALLETQVQQYEEKLHALQATPTDVVDMNELMVF